MGSGRGWLASDWPSTGAFSALLRQPGLWASTGGVLATKSERKMLAICLVLSLFGQKLVHAVTNSEKVVLFRNVSDIVYSHADYYRTQ